MVRRCPVCGRNIKEGEGIQANVIIKIHQRGILYSATYGIMTFCGEECRKKWEESMETRLRELERRKRRFYRRLMAQIILLGAVIPILIMLIIFFV